VYGKHGCRIPKGRYNSKMAKVLPGKNGRASTPGNGEKIEVDSPDAGL
jgi:hypothetical protein